MIIDILSWACLTVGGVLGIIGGIGIHRFPDFPDPELLYVCKRDGNQPVARYELLSAVYSCVLT